MTTMYQAAGDTFNHLSQFEMHADYAILNTDEPCDVCGDEQEGNRYRLTAICEGTGEEVVLYACYSCGHTLAF